MRDMNLRADSSNVQSQNDNLPMSSSLRQRATLLDDGSVETEGVIFAPGDSVACDDVNTEVQQVILPPTQPSTLVRSRPGSR